MKFIRFLKDNVKLILAFNLVSCVPIFILTFSLGYRTLISYDFNHGAVIFILLFLYILFTLGLSTIFALVWIFLFSNRPKLQKFLIILFIGIVLYLLSENYTVQLVLLDPLIMYLPIIIPFFSIIFFIILFKRNKLLTIGLIIFLLITGFLYFNPYLLSIPLLNIRTYKNEKTGLTFSYPTTLKLTDYGIWREGTNTIFFQRQPFYQILCNVGLYCLEGYPSERPSIIAFHTYTQRSYEQELRNYDRVNIGHDITFKNYPAKEFGSEYFRYIVTKRDNIVYTIQASWDSDKQMEIDFNKILESLEFL